MSERNHSVLGNEVIVGAAARDLRRALPATAWVVLEELFLTAQRVKGRIEASTSARAVAACLGVDAGTAAAALRRLRTAGLVDLEQRAADRGRFGLSVYVLNDVAGVRVVPCAAPPHTEITDRSSWRRRGDAGVASTEAQPAFDLGWGSTS